MSAKLFWLLTFFVCSNSQCLDLTPDAFEEELLKLGIKRQQLIALPTQSYYEGLNVYLNHGAKREHYGNEGKKKVQLMEFDLENAVLNANFDFRKRFFFDGNGSKYIPYRPRCFTVDRQGFFLFTQEIEHSRYSFCHLQVTQAPVALRLLRDFAQLFINLEAEGVWVTPLDFRSVACDVEAPASPRIAKLNSFFGTNDSFFLHQYADSLLKRSDERNRILALYSGNTLKDELAAAEREYEEAKPMVRNAYSFLYSLHEMTSELRVSYHSTENSPSIVHLRKVEAKLGEMKGTFGKQNRFLAADDVQQILALLHVPNVKSAGKRSPSPPIPSSKDARRKSPSPPIPSPKNPGRKFPSPPTHSSRSL